MTNPAWAAEILGKWIEEATAAYYDPSLGFADASQATIALKHSEHRASRIIQAILGLEQPPTLVKLVPSSPSVVLLQEGIDLAAYALGVLETQEDTDSHVTGSSAPAMSADAFHPLVWQAASRLWSDGHYGQAVQRAATFLNAHVQDRCGRHDVSDATLMAQVFSLDAPRPDKPRLRWPGNDADLTVKAMRSGLLNMSQGCFLAIRNPATHGTDEVSRQVAFEYLAVLSALARWIDLCVLAEVAE